MPPAWFDSSDPRDEGWQARLDGLVETHVAHRLEEVLPTLAHADRAARERRWAAVVVSYEAAPAFEPALAGKMAPAVPGLPLAWVGVFERGESTSNSQFPTPKAPTLDLWPQMARDDFVERALRVQEYIRSGDTYQVNLTFPLEGLGAPDYDDMRAAQQARYCAQIDLGSHHILSFSPELFFERAGRRLTTRPMKGTAPRGRWRAEDEAIAAQLARSPKERAENVMIVDMLRNDVGRVAEPGSVRVPSLFATERYPTLWQMTSTVEGTIAPETTTVDVFRALFPCGSVTGAPKIRTMEIIAELEGRPRGVYTGAIGLVRPGGDCTFSVAIRTLVVDKSTGRATLGVGAGVTADSTPEAEYDESLLKARFLSGQWAVGSRQGGSDALHSPAHGPLPTAHFELLETMRLEAGTIARLERHLHRAGNSAAYFGFAWDESRIRPAIDAAARAHPGGVWRCRLLVAADGMPTVECAPHQDEGRVWRVAFASEPVDDRDPFLFNKTTRRVVHETARRRRPDLDDVVLWNARGEVTESTIANVVIELDGVRLTPPVASGLLAGVFRGELLERGEIREQVLTRRQVARASRIWLINSVRGWIEATLIA